MMIQNHYGTDLDISNSDFDLAEKHLYYFYNTMIKAKKFINEKLYDPETNSYCRNIEDKKMDISILGAVEPFKVFKPKEKKIKKEK